MIAEKIYNGFTAEELGITEVQYLSRKSVVDQFISEVTTFDDFKVAYAKWVSGTEHGSAKNNGRITETTCTACGSREIEQDSTPDASFGEMFSGLASSIRAIIKSGVEVVSIEEHQRRFKICLECEHLVFGNCKKCRCFMRLKTKYAAVSCKIGKW